MAKPTVGRVVHLNADAYPGQKLAGLVVGVDGDRINVAAWSPMGEAVTFLGVPEAGATAHPLDGFATATWEWPARVIE